MSDIVLKSAPSPMGFVKSAWAGLRDLFATIGAAAAVADAVENRRQPTERDLAVLGLKREQFPRYY